MFSEKELSQNKKPTQFLVRIDTQFGYEVYDIDMEIDLTQLGTCGL